MPTNHTVTLDTKSLSDILDNLNEDNRRLAMLSALRAGGKVLQANTKESLKKKLGSGATSTSDRNKFPMEKGVRLIVDKDYNEVVVSIMKDYRLKWFEMGSDQRYLKKDHPKDEKHRKTLRKGEYRGRIGATNFFGEARQNEGPVCDAIVEELAKQINKLMK
ncbi:MAG: hypothetical protein HDT42_11490 [Ruminococcaceae bacterium]|nr:hypothetical protein [Oscillospiraceae bacterium]